MHLILVATVAAIVALAIVGVVLRLRGEGSATAACSAVSSEAKNFESALSRHLGEGTSRLITDTTTFVTRVEARKALDCRELKEFVVGSRATLTDVCRPCAAKLALAAGLSI